MSVPSPWPIRNERRQAAINRDTKMLDTRLSSSEQSLELITDKLNDLCNAIQIGTYPTNRQDMDTFETISAISDRVEKMELLLLRFSLDDFRALDRDIIKLVPRRIEPTTTEPEVEKSPMKMPMPKYRPECIMDNKCLHFNIAGDEDQRSAASVDAVCSEELAKQPEDSEQPSIKDLYWMMKILRKELQDSLDAHVCHTTQERLGEPMMLPLPGKGPHIQQSGAEASPKTPMRLWTA
mmetsp:Transcript_98520/g.299005  ORF Transcript_98520/g.299005 Transcript_98520/m.299005 type:complete len:237 (-) Transcript_98520:212-922(-)